MNYLTYEEYTSLGGVLDVTAFNRNIDCASLEIDIRTNLRLQNKELFNSYDEALRVARIVCRDLIDYFSVNSVDKKVITSRSESAGNVSESENYAVKASEDYAADVERICKRLEAVYTKNGVVVTYGGAMS